MTMTIAIAAGAVILLLGAGGALTKIGPWYRGLAKPSWNPPDWLFGPAWTIILGLAAWAGVTAWEAAATAADQQRILILFGVNFLLHLLWSPLFFIARRPDWSLIEAFFLWGSVLALAIGLAPYSAMTSWLLMPYLAWVSFAILLNWRIVQLNRPFSSARA
ncbi:MAG: TspO/MBR family protein [Pseudomonadota bacterium]